MPDPANPQAFNRYSYVLNNPLRYTDPSGHDFWSKLGHEVSRPQNAFALQQLPGFHEIGTYALSQSTGGRNILAGEIVAGTAAATFYCLGCSVVASGAIQGALVGEGIGAYSSRGDMLGGVIRGGLIGGAIGGAFAEAGALTKGMNPLIQIGAKGMIGGTASTMLGGSFEKGFLFAAAAATAYWYYTDSLGYAPDPLPGQNDLPNGYYDPSENGGIPPEHSNVWGVDDGENGWFSQEQTVSKAANLMPGQSALAHLHDFWLNTGTVTSNFGSMFPAGVVSYSALMSVSFSPLLMEQAVGNSRGF